MSISPIGASSVSALTLSKLLGSSSSSSSTDDLSSLLGISQDTLSISPEAQWMNRSQGSNPFKTDFDNLGSLIQSGDITSAKKAYAAMLEKMQAHSSAQNGQDAITAQFAAIGKALASDDTATAQSAWSTMQSGLQNMGQNASNPMQKDLEQLNGLIAAGDLTSASTLFQSIQDKFKAHEKSGTSTSGGSSTLDSEFSALQAALKSGDAEAAKTTFAALQTDLQKAPPPPPPSTSSSTQASSGVSDLDVLLLSSYWNYPSLLSKSSTSEIG